MQISLCVFMDTPGWIVLNNKECITNQNQTHPHYNFKSTPQHAFPFAFIHQKSRNSRLPYSPQKCGGVFNSSRSQWTRLEARDSAGRGEERARE